MDSLTERQVTALKTLEKMHMGKTIAFLNWADADGLVQIGLADSSGKGKYAITQKGLDVLHTHHAKE